MQVRYSTSATMTNASAWTASPATFTGLNSNTTYYVQCLGTNTRGNSANGSTVAATTVAVVITSTPGLTYYGTNSNLVCTDNNNEPYMVLAANGAKPVGADCHLEIQYNGWWDPNGLVFDALGSITHPLYCVFQVRARWFIGTNFGPWSQTWGRSYPEPGCQ
jgi:hypothetical protein